MEKIKEPAISDKRQRTREMLLVFLVANFLLLVALPAQAASLYFSPSSGSYEVGKTFSVSVYLSSADQAMNAASGIISFSQAKLEVISFSKSGSIFTLWVQEPLFSNSAGTINFEGIVLNPGFIGVSGKIITISFKVKAAGTAFLNFSSGSVLANDGKGTNILESLRNAQFSLGSVSPATPTVPGTPSAPQISSPTHPDPNKWYAKKDAKFTWPIPSDVTGVRLLYNKYPTSQPSVVYSPPISEKQLKDVNDGIYYLHAQFRNSHGWGEASHFRFQIDTQPPEPFFIEFVHGKKTIDPNPIITFNATDTLSGIDYYRIKIGEKSFFEVNPNSIISNLYTLPSQEPGKHTVVVQAYDKAGNITTETEEFEILPIKPSKFVQIGSVTITIFAVVISLVVLLLVLLLVLFWYAWHKLSLLRKRLRKEVREVESVLHKAFNSLKEDIREQIKMLEKTRTKRQLTKEEEKIIKQLKRNLDDAEKFVRKEIKDIKKAV